MPGYTHLLREVDTGIEHVLRYPGKTLIGRARLNDIQPDNGSVSKQHAVIELDGDPEEPCNSSTLEDLHTRNGTFSGHPDRLVVVNGKKPLKMGEYIKFGDYKNLYIFEAIRNLDEKSQSPAKSQMSLLDRRDDSVFDDKPNMLNKSFERADSLVAGTVGSPIGRENKQTGPSTMSISINYPSAPGAQRQAVSIQIDPRPDYSGEQSQERTVLSPQRVSFENTNRPLRRSLNSGRVNADGELDLSGDYSRAVGNAVLTEPAMHSRTFDNGLISGNVSLDVAPRLSGPPRMESAPRSGYPKEVASGTNDAARSVDRELSPLTVLTEKEREDVEKMRKSLSDGIRMTNQVLAGVVKFDDWKQHAKRIIGDSQQAVQDLQNPLQPSSRSATKGAKDPSAADTLLALQSEVAGELSAERPLPVESSMAGRLSSALSNLRSLPMVLHPRSLKSNRLLETGQRKIFDLIAIQRCLNSAIEDILGAVESPLGMALEGLDAFLENEKEKSGLAAQTGSISNLRSAVSKIRGLSAFLRKNGSKVPKIVTNEYASFDPTDPPQRTWLQEGTSSRDFNVSELRSKPKNLSELIQSVEVGAPGGVMPLEESEEADSTPLSQEQLDQIARYVVLSVIEEDVQPVLNRISKEKEREGIGNVDGESKQSGIKFADFAEMEEIANRLSSSFAKNEKNSVASKREAVDADLDSLNAELFGDGELRLSAGKSSAGLSSAKLNPPVRGRSSPTPSVAKGLASRGGGSVAGNSPRDMSMSVEHVQQLNAVNKELEALERQHKEELNKLMAQVELDKQSMQNRSEKERLELEEQRRRDLEMMEAEMNGQKNALLQERENVLAEAEEARIAKIQYMSYKFLTKLLERYRTMVQAAFKRWASTTNSYKKYIVAKSTKILQLKRVLRIYCEKNTKTLQNALNKWNRTILRRAYDRAIAMQMSSQHELLRLREQCRISAEQLNDIARGSDVYASLLAEKALNRELASSNLELFNTLNDTQERIIEMAKIPSSEGKKLVRDVIMSREGELARSRREARSLKDRIEHLESVLTGLKSAGSEGGRAFSSAPENSRIRGAAAGGLAVPGFMTTFMNGGDGYSNRSADAATLEAIDYLAPVDQKKKQALSVILMELTRLRKVNAERAAEVKYLSDIFAKQLAKISETEIVAHVLQQRLAHKERRISSILSFVRNNFDGELIQRFNDHYSGVGEVINEKNDQQLNFSSAEDFLVGTGALGAHGRPPHGADCSSPEEYSRNDGNKFDKYTEGKKKNKSKKELT